jgi:hypothetical protein
VLPTWGITPIGDVELVLGQFRKATALYQRLELPGLALA